MLKAVDKEEFGKRLRLVFKELNIKSQRQFALSINADVSYFSKGYNGKFVLSNEYLDAIEKKFGINKEWLLYGEGKKTIEKSTEKYPTGEAKILPISFERLMTVPVLTVQAQAGYLKGNADLNYLEKLETMLLPIECEKGNYIVVEVNGDSMNDGTERSILDGDKLLVKEIGKDIWMFQNLQRRNYLYALATATEGLVIKEITHHDVPKGLIICHSLNTLFKDFTLPVDEVYKIFSINKIIERKIR